jgi:hypothetical protein
MRTYCEVQEDRQLAVAWVFGGIWCTLAARYAANGVSSAQLTAC